MKLVSSENFLKFFHAISGFSHSQVFNTFCRTFFTVLFVYSKLKAERKTKLLYLRII
jgi:hypothetical protein